MSPDETMLPVAESATMSEQQSQRVECLRWAAELTPVATLDDRWRLAAWLFDGTER